MGHSVCIRSVTRHVGCCALVEELTYSCKMIKAIWPSIARMPNHLSPSASITSSGKADGMSKLCIRSPFFRSPMLLHLLADPVSLHAHPTTQSEVFVLRQGCDSPDSVASNGHLGVCSRSAIQRAFRRACNHNWDTVFLELAECAEQCAGYLLRFVCQYP